MTEKTEKTVTCDNCDWTGSEDELSRSLYQIHHLAERLDPGSVVPAGECPECSCLAYIDPTPEERATERLRAASSDMLAALLDVVDQVPARCQTKARLAIARAKGVRLGDQLRGHIAKALS